MSLFKKILRFFTLLKRINDKLEYLQQAIGRIESRQLENRPTRNLADMEFKVFSQFGEDGIIQYLIRHVPIKERVFVEFGVEDYTESNTRFLLQNNNWDGLVIDGSARNIDYIKSDRVYWRHSIKAECAFIDRENICSLIQKNGISGDIGLLSIDIDGNDYWVWEKIECISPRIVICEYNSIFGPRARISVPYNKFFMRSKAHFTNLYWGASISALDYLAQKKGYSLLGSNSAGNNVFFVRNDLRGSLPVQSPAQAYVRSQFRESRDLHGKLTYLSHQEGIQLLSDMPVYNFDKQEVVKMADIKDLL